MNKYGGTLRGDLKNIIKFRWEARSEKKGAWAVTRREKCTVPTNDCCGPGCYCTHYKKGILNNKLRFTEKRYLARGLLKVWC